MPMEIFVVARVGLATLGGVRIALDLSLSSTLGYFYPRRARLWRVKASPRRCVSGRLVEFLRRRGDSKTLEVTRLWTYAAGT